MYQINHSILTFTFYYLHNHKQLGGLILVGGALTSLEQNLVELRHMIATITDT